MGHDSKAVVGVALRWCRAGVYNSGLQSQTRMKLQATCTCKFKNGEVRTKRLENNILSLNGLRTHIFNKGRSRASHEISTESKKKRHIKGRPFLKQFCDSRAS